MAALKAAIQKEVNAAKVLIKLYLVYRAKQKRMFRFYALQDESCINVRDDKEEFSI